MKLLALALFSLILNIFSCQEKIIQQDGLSSLRILAPTNCSMPIVNISYSCQLQARGGKTPYTWKVISGKLPSGLSLGLNTGVIAGIPLQIGKVKVLIQVTDSSQAFSQAIFEFNQLEERQHNEEPTETYVVHAVRNASRTSSQPNSN